MHLLRRTDRAAFSDNGGEDLRQGRRRERLEQDVPEMPQKGSVGRWRVQTMKQKCVRCGEPIMTLSEKMIEKIYGKDGDVKCLSKMCPKCRRKALWEGVVFKL